MKKNKSRIMSIGESIASSKSTLKKEAMACFVSDILKIPKDKTRIMSRKELSGLFSKALLKAKKVALPCAQK